MSYKEFSMLIKYKRMEMGYTQKQFAKILLINQSTYSKIENGYVEPSFMNLQLICKYLEIDLTEILELKKTIINHRPFYD